MKILFVFPYPLGRAASQRFRFEQYLDILRNEGHELSLSPFLNEEVWNIFYQRGYLLKKTWALFMGFSRRFKTLFSIRSYDYVFIHREALPIGPPVYEWLLSKVFSKKIIYDFDDSIWIPNSSESNKFFLPLKTHSNVFRICKWSYKISAGNTYLSNIVSAYNPNVVVNPTTIDIENHHNRIKEKISSPICIGWTGSHSTNKYLEEVSDLMKELSENNQVKFLVISDIKPSLKWDGFEFKHWNKSSEIEDLSEIDIGIMPLTHDKWSEGKCGFKALQYMALGIPALVSPVGVNEEIVDDRVNGFICREASDWKEKILYLKEHPEKCLLMGQAARKKIEERYSVSSNRSNFLLLFT